MAVMIACFNSLIGIIHYLAFATQYSQRTVLGSSNNIAHPLQAEAAMIKAGPGATNLQRGTKHH